MTLCLHDLGDLRDTVFINFVLSRSRRVIYALRVYDLPVVLFLW